MLLIIAFYIILLYSIYNFVLGAISMMNVFFVKNVFIFPKMHIPEILATRSNSIAHEVIEYFIFFLIIQLKYSSQMNL